MQDRLIEAVMDGYLGVVRTLIATGADINHTHLSYTPLIQSIIFGHSEIASTLISAKANLHMGDFLGNTPLIYAALRGNVQIVQTLIDNKANLNALNHLEYSALTVAAFKNKLEVIQILLNAGAHVDRTQLALNHSLQKLHEIKLRKIAFLKDIRGHFLQRRNQITHDLIDNIISFERMNLLILTKAERYTIYRFIELVDSLAKKTSPILLKSLNHQALLPTHRLPEQPLLERMARLVKLFDSKDLSKVHIHVLIDLIKINGALLYSIPTHLKQNIAFFQKILGIKHCDRNDDVRKRYILSFVAKQTCKPALAVLLGVFLINQMIDLPISKSQCFFIGFIAALFGRLYTLNKAHTHTRSFFDNRHETEELSIPALPSIDKF